MKVKKISPFSTPAQDARISRLVTGGAATASRPMTARDRDNLLSALFGDRAAVAAAVQLLAAYRSYSAQLRHRVRTRPGRPAEELRDWFVGRARRIFRAARSDDERSREDPARVNRGALRPLDEGHQEEVEFIRLVARIAGARLPRDMRALFDMPAASISAAAATVPSGDAVIAPGLIPERQRVVERIAKKSSQGRSTRAVGVLPKIGPGSVLATKIRERLESGASVAAIARELGCSRHTVRRYRSH